MEMKIKDSPELRELFLACVKDNKIQDEIYLILMKALNNACNNIIDSEIKNREKRFDDSFRKPKWQ